MGVMLRLALLCFVSLGAAKEKPPHLVLMVLDDTGYDDVGYHGSDFPTPNIDKLATEGVRLERYYVQQVCSPTRSALISGRYPFRTGMQHKTTLRAQSPAHLPLNATTVAEALGKVGYRRYAIGKWHLGYASWNYTPVGRGFESHAGYLQGAGDYYNHTLIGASGFDFWRNKSVAKDQIGRYSMDFYMDEAKRIVDNHTPEEPLFLYFAHQVQHLPLQSPPEEVYSSNCAHINKTLPDGENRHVICTMASRLDAAIGDFVSMLKTKGLWENTIMWVVSDNGGMTHWGPQWKIRPASVGCNYPLRGGKATLFEGGMRVVSFVTGGRREVTAAAGSVREQLLQHVDTPATLAALGGADLGDDADGFNVWDVITNGQDSPRTEVPLNIDTSPGIGDLANFSALIQGRWKLINAASTITDGWWSSEPYTRTAPNSSQVQVKIDGWEVMLFDIFADPQERQNVASANPEIVRKMIKRIEELSDPANGYRPPQPQPTDPRGDPENHDGCYAPWLDESSTTYLAITV